MPRDDEDRGAWPCSGGPLRHATLTRTKNAHTHNHPQWWVTRKVGANARFWEKCRDKEYTEYLAIFLSCFSFFSFCLSPLSTRSGTHTHTHSFCLVNPWLPCCTPVQYYDGIWHRLQLCLEKGAKDTHTHTHTHTVTKAHNVHTPFCKDTVQTCVSLHIYQRMCLTTLAYACGCTYMCFCVHMCVCVCVRECVCACMCVSEDCRGLSNGDTVLLYVKQAVRQTVCQFFWSRAGRSWWWSGASMLSRLTYTIHWWQQR